MDTINFSRYLRSYKDMPSNSCVILFIFLTEKVVESLTALTVKLLAIVISKLAMGSKKFVLRVPVFKTVVICLELSLR